MHAMRRAFDTFWRDSWFTARMLAARPGWTAAAVICLAIATGANTAAFTIVNGLLLRPLPFDRTDALVMVALREPAQAGHASVLAARIPRAGGERDAFGRPVRPHVLPGEPGGR